jgi:hypothetical protein
VSAQLLSSFCALFLFHHVFRYRHVTLSMQKAHALLGGGPVLIAKVHTDSAEYKLLSAALGSAPSGTSLTSSQRHTKRCGICCLLLQARGVGCGFRLWILDFGFWVVGGGVQY